MVLIMMDSVSESDQIRYCNVNDKKNPMQMIKPSFYMFGIY